jgi:drug/metabolite transporter (DMT)-like permease
MSSALSSTARTARLKADLTLLLAATIWGTAFVAQRTAAQSSGVFLFNGLRFLLGALVLLPFVLREQRSQPLHKISRRDQVGILVAGLLLFTAGSFQQMGLQYTTAGNAGFITGLYVVFIPIILAAGRRQHLGRYTWGASLLAALGLFLLSTSGQMRLAFGDALVLVSAVMFALHVIWIGHLVQRMDVLPLAAGQYLVTALVSLGIGALVESDLAAVITNAWLPILYTGIFSIGLGYTFQAIGQRLAPPADAAILLSMEAPIAAISGWLLLGESLAPIQLAGAGLMLAGMLLAQLPLIRGTPRSNLH